jgi:succinate dehydrogenase/fumarate reductase cytochrome b subunit
VKKLHSLSGVVPVGVFLIEHLWTNSRALQGEDAFNQAVGDIQNLPYLPLIEVFGIFLPLAFHSFYGLYLAFRGKPNALKYPYATNWLFGMRSEAFYQTLEAHLSSTYGGVPWLALLYMVGVGSAVFHFANGLAGVCMAWGLTVTKVAQRRAAVVCGAIGLALFFLGANTVLFFATGTRFYLRSDVSGLAPHGVDEAAPGGPTPVIAVPGANPGAPTAAKPGGPAPSGH